MQRSGVLIGASREFLLQYGPCFFPGWHFGIRTVASPDLACMQTRDEPHLLKKRRDTATEKKRQHTSLKGERVRWLLPLERTHTRNTNTENHDDGIMIQELGNAWDFCQ